MFPQLRIGPFAFGSYGLLSAAGVVLAVLWLKSNRKKMGLSENAFWAAIWSLFLGAVVGSKLLFVALAWPEYASGRMRLFADFDYGFVYFGGLLGAGLAGLAFARRRKLGYLRGADYFGVALPLGHAVGRLGCFAAGCCHGRCATVPWAVRFTDPECLVPPAFRGIPLHPVQVYEAAGNIVIAATVYVILTRVEQGRLRRGTAFQWYLALYGVLRLTMDFFRGDGRPERFLGLSHQQGFALACLLMALTPPPRHPSEGSRRLRRGVG